MGGLWGMGQGVPVPIQARSIRAPISVSLLPIPHPVSVRPAPRTCLPCQPALSTHPSLSSLRPPTFMQPPVPPSMHTHSFLSLHSSIQLCRPQLLVHPSIPPCVFICPSLHPCTPLTPACLQPPAQPRAPVPLVRLSACPSEMRALQGLGAGLGLLSLGLALGALSSDTWLVARSPGFASSSGLWCICLNDACRPFLIVPGTRMPGSVLSRRSGAGGPDAWHLSCRWGWGPGHLGPILRGAGGLAG